MGASCSSGSSTVVWTKRRENDKVEGRLDLNPLFLYVKAKKLCDDLVLYHSFIGSVRWSETWLKNTVPAELL